MIGKPSAKTRSTSLPQLIISVLDKL